MISPRDILSFWFGAYHSFACISFQNQANWFKKDPEFDTFIKTRFEQTLKSANRGKYDHWLIESPEHSLALLILFDQFPRNMYRNSPQSFAYDSKARVIAQLLLQNPWKQPLPTPARIFLQVALSHSEDYSVQRQALQVGEALVADAEEEYKQIVRENAKYAEMHAGIIERFGRFPHRNEVLGRESSPEEVEFLRTFPGF
jgi:uncharacterized protein (DUF924 family)